MNSYVGSRYSLPFTSTAVPPVLRSLSEDIACYFAIRGSFTQDGASRNDYADSYREAIEVLERIADGTIPLTYTNGSIVSAISARIDSSSEGYTPIFGKDEPEDWDRDSDEVSDQDTART